VKIDFDKIKSAFPGKAWAYAECLDSIRIGKWDGMHLIFRDGLDESLLLMLRVFNEKRELKLNGEKSRDTDIYKNDELIADLADERYIMYGEHSEPDGEYTTLWEERGGVLYFPAKLVFPDKNVSLKLGIKNFVRYNPVPVCPKGEKHDFGMGAGSAGAIEVFDYAYTGFYYSDGKAVEL
jgi:CRISPR-associated protein (TIGR03984 family)